MLALYRVIYGVVAGLVLYNLLTTHYYGDVPRSLPWLILACKISLAGLVLAAALIHRLKPSVIWGVVLVWEALLVWYGWFSPGAPFALYRSVPWVTPLFIGLVLWFISLAIVRSAKAWFARTDAGGRIPSDQ